MRQATTIDYVRVQGGRPVIELKNGLYHIHHYYLPGTPLVRTLRDPSVDEVAMEVNGEVILFHSGELWQFEGGPCQLQSLINGGHGYDHVHEPHY